MNPQQYSVKDVDELRVAISDRIYAQRKNEKWRRAIDMFPEFDEVILLTQTHILAGHKAADIKAQTEAESNG